MTEMPKTPQARLAAVRAEIAQAAREAGRDPSAVKLVAVAKTFGGEEIEPAIAAGHTLFGENRVQEAQKKWPELKRAHPGVELHLIGPLQSNKAGDAVALFDAIHTVDRAKIAGAIAREMEKQDRRPELLVQVNTGEEPQKAGVAPQDAAALVARCRDEFGLEIAGLMCLPPLEDAPAPHFALLAQLAADLGLAELSMGMSADFATAVKFGATYVRVGTAVFGERG